MKASQTDFYYKLIDKNHSKTFWQKHENHKKPGYYSEEFKEFFSAAIQANPVHRPTISEMLAHPWL